MAMQLYHAACAPSTAVLHLMPSQAGRKDPDGHNADIDDNQRYMTGQREAQSEIGSCDEAHGQGQDLIIATADGFGLF